MNPWLDWFLRLLEEAKKFPALHFDGPDRADRFRQREMGSEKLIESAVDQFARQGTWPKLPPDAAAMLRERLDFAADFANWQGTLLPDSAPPKLATPDLWKWWLLEVWNHAGFEAIDGILERLQPTGNPERPSLN